jgi:hypothetical protein
MENYALSFYSSFYDDEKFENFKIFLFEFAQISVINGCRSPQTFKVEFGKICLMWYTTIQFNYYFGKLSSTIIVQ